MTPGASPQGTPLLAVENLRVRFHSGPVQAVDGLSFELAQGEALGIVGESGCGKSATALNIMRLIDSRTAAVSGRILFDGIDLLTLDERAIRRLRGKAMGMVFQEPLTSLNPVMTIGRQITESIRLHDGLSAAEARNRAIEMLRLVRIADPERRLDDYPHRLSGGMRQRVMIALALACSPRILIADEPTTALDVTVQAQILDLLLEIKERLGMAILLITHDLGVVAQRCDRVVVMYAGQKIEEAPVASLFDAPLHPYTKGLMRSVPRLPRGDRIERLAEISGTVPSLAHPPPGCRFAPRCTQATADCHALFPPWREALPEHGAACWRVDEKAEVA